MRRLIWGFAGRTYQIVGNLMSWLKSRFTNFWVNKTLPKATNLYTTDASIRQDVHPSINSTDIHVSFVAVHLSIQWATSVTHHFLRAHIFWQKCWNRTFSMIIYLLTFNLFDNIEKKNLESLMRIILLLKGNFGKFWKMHVQAERLNFLFLFCARHYPRWSLWQKNTKSNLFIQVKPLFSVVEFSNTVTFWWNACFNVILTSVTIIKLDFLRKLFCNESLVDIEVSKH